jgi:hypothetical protein
MGHIVDIPDIVIRNIRVEVQDDIPSYVFNTMTTGRVPAITPPANWLEVGRPGDPITVGFHDTHSRQGKGNTTTHLANGVLNLAIHEALESITSVTGDDRFFPHGNNDLNRMIRGFVDSIVRPWDEY